MNDEQKKLLEEWHTRLSILDGVYNKYSSLIDIESDLMDAMFRTTDSYTKSVAKLLQVDEEWLFWWHCDCEFGKRPMEAWVGDKKYLCTSLDVLVNVLEDDV